jgi:uncharacterized membrane protein
VGDHGWGRLPARRGGRRRQLTTKLSYLVKGLPGHPLYPPLTDVTIGTYTFATVAAVLDVTGLVEQNTAYAWWIALVIALVSTVLTATTGFIDWIEIEWGSELWKTATVHMTAMLAASRAFLGAALVGHSGYTHGRRRHRNRRRDPQPHRRRDGTSGRPPDRVGGELISFEPAGHPCPKAMSSPWRR